MQRSFSSPALVLRVRSSGESNREAVFLSAEEGIVSATLFGGPKSRLRSHVSPFNSGILFTYRDPAKDFRKVSDFDVESWRPGLRELYERSAEASRIAGTILLGHGGGAAFGETYTLANKTLDALSSADEACCERLFIYFMWNWAGILGNRSDLGRCAFCACELPHDEVIWFIPGEGLLCKRCISNQEKKGQVLGPEARSWLLTAEKKSPPEISKILLDDESLGELKILMKMLI